MPLFGYNARKIQDDSRAINARRNGTYSNQPSAREYNMTMDGEIGNPSDPVKVRQVLANKAIPDSKPKTTNNGSGGGSSIIPDYKANLGDLYNKVMGYGGYSYTPYTPGSYSPTVDTSGTQAALKSALGDIQNYGDSKYDLNADLL